MNEGLTQLIEISRYYGKQKEFVIAGGGNTSYKTNEHLYVKASGTSLSIIDENGFCKLDRNKLKEIPEKQFSTNPSTREEEVKTILLNSRINPETGLRPSVETSLHDLFNYNFVVHTHPTLVNGLMSCNKAEELTEKLFGEKALYIPYIDPGYILFKEIEKRMGIYTQTFGNQPKLVFIQNHGIFVAANTVDEIKSLYTFVFDQIEAELSSPPIIESIPVNSKISDVLPAIRMIFSDDTLKIATAFNNTLIADVVKNNTGFNKIAKPYNPDQIVYCKSEYLFIKNTTTSESIISEVKNKKADFENRNGFPPKLIFVKNEGVIVIEESASAVKVLKDIVNDFVQISVLAENFGGPHPMEQQQIDFINSWEVEHYRRKVAMAKNKLGKIENKIIIVTGAAQGFGAGIAQLLFDQGANIVVADMNEKKGKEFANELNALGSKNKAVFLKVNVSDASSVENLVRETVLGFGGLDVMISNAGILRAGSLEEMTPENFELMTKVNYTGYFLCAKYAKPVMKLQSEFKSDFYMDIIQINSKSGLKGSNKNFAYAGGKFGGIGLTQSFALELMPYNIKVNSVCPGNFFDGPLWSDPNTGLFVQYLKAGKVPGAKTINDVKAFYEAQVPAGRGCTAEDVVKAIFYIIDQEYETGQAVPVTGGQNMLN